MPHPYSRRRRYLYTGDHYYSRCYVILVPQAFIYEDRTISFFVAVSPHSCNATFLSLASKVGVPLEYRYISGYHRCPGQDSVRSYSRDHFPEPLRRLGLVFDDVAWDIVA